MAATELADAASLAALVVTSFTHKRDDADEVTNAEDDSPAQLYHGQGTATFASGNVYSGPFVNGYMTGSNGTYTWSDGVKYSGDFLKNKIVGSGVYEWTNGCKYEGQVENSLRHGKGIFVCETSSSRYEGDWQKGIVHGHGKLLYDGGSYYEGEWRDGMKHGKGVMMYASGSVYDGQWESNLKSGRGTMRWADCTYEGEWKNGLPNGHGTHVWSLRGKAQAHQFPMRNKYIGHWLDGKRDGYGVFQYASGALYEGEWKDDMKHGHGKYVSEHGRYYIGSFQNDRPVGTMPKYQNDCPYVFPLPSPAASPEDELKDINNVILRYIVSLRQIYTYYATLGRTTAELDDSGALTRHQLLRFLRDCELTHKDITVAAMDRAYAVTYKQDPVFQDRYERPHDPHARFILFDFLTYLLRIAHLLYEGEQDLKVHDKGIAGEIAQLIKYDVLEKARTFPEENEGSTSAAAKTWKLQLLYDLEKEIGERLYNLYADLSNKRYECGATASYRDVLLMLQDYGLLSQTSLTVDRVLNVFVSTTPPIFSSGDYNLEHELVPCEFLEVLFECAVLIQEEFWTEVVVPILNGDAPATAKYVLFNEVVQATPIKPDVHVVPPAVTEDSIPATATATTLPPTPSAPLPAASASAPAHANITPAAKQHERANDGGKHLPRKARLNTLSQDSIDKEKPRNRDGKHGEGQGDSDGKKSKARSGGLRGKDTGSTLSINAEKEGDGKKLSKDSAPRGDAIEGPVMALSERSLVTASPTASQSQLDATSGLSAESSMDSTSTTVAPQNYEEPALDPQEQVIRFKKAVRAVFEKLLAEHEVRQRRRTLGDKVD